MEKDLIHDSLTSLKTRAFFEQECKTYLSSIGNSNNDKRHEWFGFKNLSILFFDIDDFKKVNDIYGHLVGDTVLKNVAHTIKESVREGDTVARWGGDEMAASLLGANEADAKNKAEEIRKKIDKLTFDSAPDLKMTVSIGIANTSENIPFEKLLECADKALYRAKENGRDRAVVHSEL